MIVFKVLIISLFLLIVTAGIMKVDKSNRVNYIMTLVVLSILIGVM